MARPLAQDGFTGKYVYSRGKRHRLVSPTALLEWLCEGGCGRTICNGKLCSECEDVDPNTCLCGNVRLKNEDACLECK